MNWKKHTMFFNFTLNDVWKLAVEFLYFPWQLLLLLIFISCLLCQQFYLYLSLLISEEKKITIATAVMKTFSGSSFSCKRRAISSYSSLKRKETHQHHPQQWQLTYSFPHSNGHTNRTTLKLHRHNIERNNNVAEEEREKMAWINGVGLKSFH